MSQPAFTPVHSRQRWVMLGLSFATAFLLHLLLFATAPMVTRIIEELNISHADFGLLFSMAIISLIIFRLPWGVIGDRIGYINAFRIALPLTAVFALLRAFAPGYQLLLAIQFFLGLGLAVMLPCLPLLVKEWAPRNTGLATGVYIAGFAAGNATALGLTPQLLVILHWRQVLLIYGGLAILIGLLWWALARSRRQSASGLRLRGLAGILKDRYVWALLAFMLASAGSYDVLTTWLPKVLELRGLNLALASLLSLGFFFAGPIIGWWLDRMAGTRVLILLLGVVAVLSTLGIGYAPLPLLLICIPLAGFSAIGILTVVLAVPAHHPRLSAVAGSTVGLIASLGNIASVGMPVLFGFLIDATGTFQASLIAVAALIGSMVLLGLSIGE
jgi:CP family cyanate transporter-like MFS transporter